MIAWVAEQYPALVPADCTPAPRHLVVEVTIGSAVAATAVLPAFLGFAEPAKRGAAALVVLRHLAGVVVCGALLALGNWIFTWCSSWWAQAGFPADLPTLVPRAGAGGIPAGSQASAGGATRIGSAQATTAPKADWYNMYTD